MDKQSIAENIEKLTVDYVCGLLELLPTKLVHGNEGMFVTLCNRISKIIVDTFTKAESLDCLSFFSTRKRIFTLYKKNNYNDWESMHEVDFTWKQFFDYLIECNYCDVIIKSDKDTPAVYFADKSCKAQFCIAFVKEDSKANI